MAATTALRQASRTSARRRTAPNASRVTIAAAALCALVTLLGFLPPPQAASYASPSVRVALETATTLIGLLAAYLVYGRYRISRRLSDFLLVCALEIIALKAMFFVGHHAVAPNDVDIFATWAQTVSVILGATVLAASAFTGDSRIKHRRRLPAVLLAVALAIGLIATIEAAVVPESHLGAEQPPAGIAYALSQAGAAILYVIAAVGFTRRAARTEDDLMRWLAVGATVAAFARLNYAVFPPFLNDRLYTGDLLRLSFAVVLLLGAAREIQQYWRSRAETAALEERRRVARDLHDGLAHELAFLSAQARSFAARHPDSEAAPLGAAAERALDEARRAIAALTRPIDEPLEVALAQAAEEVAGRTGARVRLDLAGGLPASATGREALIRITREAVANATRHGKAETVDVRLAGNPRNSGLRLTIIDDGTGFDTAAAERKQPGFGLISMRERAEGVGGVFRVESSPGGGTVVEVVVP